MSGQGLSPWPDIKPTFFSGFEISLWSEQWCVCVVIGRPTCAKLRPLTPRLAGLKEGCSQKTLGAPSTGPDPLIRQDCNLHQSAVHDASQTSSKLGLGNCQYGSGHGLRQTGCQLTRRQQLSARSYIWQSSRVGRVHPRWPHLAFPRPIYRVSTKYCKYWI